MAPARDERWDPCEMLLDRLIGRASPSAALRRAVALIEKERFSEALPLLARAAEAGLPEAEDQIRRGVLKVGNAA